MLVATIVLTTSGDRKNITPEEGTFLICTDTEELFAGNGKEVGGFHTHKKARAMSDKLEAMGVFETMESHYILTDDIDGSGGNYFLVTSDNESPIYASTELPKQSDGDVGDIIAIY